MRLSSTILAIRVKARSTPCQSHPEEIYHIHYFIALSPPQYCDNACITERICSVLPEEHQDMIERAPVLDTPPRSELPPPPMSIPVSESPASPIRPRHERSSLQVDTLWIVMRHDHDMLPCRTQGFIGQHGIGPSKYLFSQGRCWSFLVVGACWCSG